MGAFVLGILVGWLAEWLFFTFWIKGGNNAECSALKSQLEEKKREISTLQGKLESALSTAAVKKSSPTIAEVLSTGSASVPSKKPVSAMTETSTTNKTAAKEASEKASTASSTTKATTAKKAAPKKAEKKSPAKAKTTATKKAPAKAKSTANKGDDFTKISGIGPSMAATLKQLGIDSYTKLASTDDDILRDMLDASGARMNNNKEVMDSWNEQATLAAKGDFAALKKMQKAMKK